MAGSAMMLTEAKIVMIRLAIVYVGVHVRSKKNRSIYQ
jgi:hypothetical protein